MYANEVIYAGEPTGIGVIVSSLNPDVSKDNRIIRITITAHE